MFAVAASVTVAPWRYSPVALLAAALPLIDTVPAFAGETDAFTVYFVLLGVKLKNAWCFDVYPLASSLQE